MNTTSVIMQEGLQLANGKWAAYTEALVKGYKNRHNGVAPSSDLLSTTAIMLENTQTYINRMDETTKVVNMGNFVDYGFGVITAVMPALVANEIVSVQPLKGRSGEIFYLSFVYGTNKGGIKKGESMISPFTGANADTTYSGENVSEEVAQLGDETTEQNISFSLSWAPVVPKTVTIEGGNFTLTDDGNGKIITKDGTSNLVLGDGSTINYETGEVKLKFTSTTQSTLAADYYFAFGNMDIGGQIPEVDLDLKSTTISTVTRSLRARWLFDSAYELQQVHGINADEEISAALAAEIRHEIDGEIMNDLLAQASAGAQEFVWSKTAPYGVSFIDYKDTLVDLFIQMSNAIFNDTKRAEGNFIICGINVSSIVESMGGRFVPSADGMKAGPHIVGVLDGRWKIIKNPFYPADSFVVGYKGQSYLEGGYVYAPYLPLYTTPTVMLDDFVNRKGVRTIYGKKILNKNFYAKGRISA